MARVSIENIGGSESPRDKDCCDEDEDEDDDELEKLILDPELDSDDDSKLNRPLFCDRLISDGLKRSWKMFALAPSCSADLELKIQVLRLVSYLCMVVERDLVYSWIHLPFLHFLVLVRCFVDGPTFPVLWCQDMELLEVTTLDEELDCCCLDCLRRRRFDCCDDERLVLDALEDDELDDECSALSPYLACDWAEDERDLDRLMEAVEDKEPFLIECLEAGLLRCLSLQSPSSHIAVLVG